MKLKGAILRPLLAGAGALILALGLAACGSGGDDGSARDDALASLALMTEATSLEGQMGELVAGLSDDPSEAERRKLQRKLAQLEERAAELIAKAGVEPTYEVELAQINRSGAAGAATLVVAEGEVAIEGELEGMAADRPHPVAIHVLAEAQGASVCPPDDAATGDQVELTGAEAQDFYGDAAIDFGQVKEASQRATLASAAEAGDAPPLNARAVVIAGGQGSEGYEAELPIACGVPVAAVPAADRTPSAEVVAATDETRAAMLDFVGVLADPASDRATIAGERAAERLAATNTRLADALDLIRAQLEAEGELSQADRAAIDDAVAALEGSERASQRAIKKLRRLIRAALAAQRERIAQRQAAQEAAVEPGPAAPAPEPAPEAAPPADDSLENHPGPDEVEYPPCGSPEADFSPVCIP